jgi:hypothetical protein
MMGFYVILSGGRSLEDVGRRLASVCPCEVHYSPSAPVPPGQPYEVLAQPEGDSAHLRLSAPGFVEADVEGLVRQHFGDQPATLYALVYTDLRVLRTLAPHFMSDPLVSVIDEAGVEEGTDYLARLLRSAT